MDQAQACPLHEGHPRSHRTEQAVASEVRIRQNGEGQVVEVEIEIRQGEVVEVYLREEEGNDEEIHLLQVEGFAHGKIPLVFME